MVFAVLRRCVLSKIQVGSLAEMKSLKFLLRCVCALSPSGDSTWLEVIVGFIIYVAISILYIVFTKLYNWYLAILITIGICLAVVLIVIIIESLIRFIKSCFCKRK